jgi:hypothetical protein
LAHNHLPARAAAAQLAALTSTSLEPPAAAALLDQLLANFPAVVAAGSSGSSKLLEEQEGSILAAGVWEGVTVCEDNRPKLQDAKWCKEEEGCYTGCTSDYVATEPSHGGTQNAKRCTRF